MDTGVLETEQISNKSFQLIVSKLIWFNCLCVHNIVEEILCAAVKIWWLVK